jgi:GNAT superfamily N-acetyltransferase
MSSHDFRREPRLADREAIREIVESTGMFHAHEVEIAIELVAERLARGPASGYEFLFAEEDGRVVGYGCFGPIPLTRGSFDLYWIVVDRARQGRGLGRRLLGEVERLVREAGGRALYAETSGREAYEPTRRFYECHGYSAEAVLRDFYAPGDDKVVFVKRFEEQKLP